MSQPIQKRKRLSDPEKLAIVRRHLHGISFVVQGAD